VTEAERWIERLALAPHPEGGWFRETWRSRTILPRSALPPRYSSDRAAFTSIHFLLRRGERSAKHRVSSEELWVHEAGDDLRLRVTAAGADEARDVRLGPGGRLQHVVPASAWQEADLLEGPHGFVLVACVVVPGFEFEDFELA
jgi:predicted cupin superfamily sugar epimerase